MKTSDWYGELPSYKYKTFHGPSGDHILQFKFDGEKYILQQKIFVSASEFYTNPNVVLSTN